MEKTPYCMTSIAKRELGLLNGTSHGSTLAFSHISQVNDHHAQKQGQDVDSQAPRNNDWYWWL